MLGNAGDLRLSMRHAWRGETRCSDESEAQGTCGVSGVLRLGEAQERTDFRLGWDSAGGRVGVAVYGNNIFDNQYVTSLGTYGKSVLGTVGARVSEPRTWGVEMNVHF
jgi:iron complex outermembrane receptor protein